MKLFSLTQFSLIKNQSFSMGEVSDCGKYIILSVVKDCRDNIVFYANLEDSKNGITGKLDIHPVVKKFEADYEVSHDYFIYI